MKRGEMTAERIVYISLAVMGFIIVLGFLYVINFQSTSEEELCRLSVLTRATSPDKFQSRLPLKCTTGKICLTQGGDCEDAFAGEKIEKISLPKDADAAARKIEEVSAEAMYDCWSMMGEGKLDLFDSFLRDAGLEPDKPACVICKRVAIDKGVSEEIINEVNIYDYMEKNKVANTGKNYVEVFTNRQFQAYPKVDEETFKEKLEEGKDDNRAELVFGKDANEIAFVFMQIKTDGIGDTIREFWKDTLIISGAAFLTPGVKNVAGALVLSKGGLVFTGILAAGGTAVSGINAYRGQLLAAGYCGEFTSNEKAKEGCSLVQAVPYQVSNINEICNYIEGNP